jgi:hypothetical protein
MELRDKNFKRFVDEWLWIPYEKWVARLRDRRRRSSNVELYRLKNCFAMQRFRQRQKLEVIERNNRIKLNLIREVYWHEVYHPEKPLSAMNGH